MINIEFSVNDEDCAPRNQGYPIDTVVAEQLGTVLKALAEPVRLRMLSYIATTPSEESCVCDLAELTDVQQPTVSHHLKVLKEVGLLNSERRGTWVWYRIAPAYQQAVTALLASFAPSMLEKSSPPTTVSNREYSIREHTSTESSLDSLTRTLIERFPNFSKDLVQQTVRESFTALSRTAKYSSHLITLTERFARQRLNDMSRNRTTNAPQVLFVCVANAGRSQLAAALVEHHSQGRVIARSAGSAPATHVHPNIQPLLDELLTDTTIAAYPKPLTDDAVRAADVVITMGCGDVCPIIPGVRYEDWSVGDPALASAEGVETIRDDLSRRVLALLDELDPKLRTRSH